MNFPQRIGTKITAGLMAAVTLMTPVFALPGASSSEAGMDLPNTLGADASVIAIPEFSHADMSAIMDEGWLRASFQNTMSYVSGDLIEEPFATPENPAFGKISEGPLNVRTEPTSDSDRIKQLLTGYVVDIIGEQDGWYQLAEGYISSQYVEIIDASQVEAAKAEYEAALAAAKAKAEAEAKAKAEAEAKKKAEAEAKKKAEAKARAEAKAKAEAEAKKKAEANKKPQSVGASAPTKSGAAVVAYAKQFLGYPYVYGGASPSGFDCSGFVKYVFAHFGVKMNRTASAQMDNGSPVSMSNLIPGDVVFFKKAGSSASRASHVGIYIGNGQFIHASTSSTGVIISKMSSAYYTSGFVGGRRLV